jgi:type III pantothenate kinase
MRTSRCAARSREWRALSAIDAVFVASVVAPAREDELAALVRERFGLDAQFVAAPPPRSACATPMRSRSGSASTAFSLAAAHARARLQVLASVGTALTIDALAADGEHLGGLIVPSPALMRRAVVAGTARVDACEGRYRDWPASTDDGVFSGALFAAAGAIERFRGALERRFDARAALVLGGGGSDELEPLLADVERAHDLVLHGLALWAQAAPSA